MTHLSLQQRKEIYTESIRKYEDENNFKFNYLIRSLNYGLCCHFFHEYNINKLYLLPEVSSQCPKMTYHPMQNYWWKPSNRLKRLEVLKKALKIVETELKQ